MKKKLVVFLSIVLVVSLLGACGQKKSGLGVNVTDQNKSYLAKYDKSLEHFMNDMTSILKTFNDSLDGLYTKKYSREQFATVLANNIEKSNALVTEVEAVDVSPDIFESHQNLILLVNRSHQLLLDAIDMANTPERDIDKETLRSQYLDIKTQQAKIINQWKLLRKDLENGGTQNKGPVH